MYFSNSEEYGHHPCHTTQNTMNQFITKIKHKKSVKNFYTICKDSLHYLNVDLSMRFVSDCRRLLAAKAHRAVC